MESWKALEILKNLAKDGKFKNKEGLEGMIKLARSFGLEECSKIVAQSYNYVE